MKVAIPVGNQRGMSLVETLVAVLILGFAATAQIRLNFSMIETTRHAGNLNAASNLALEKIEDLVAEDYALVVSGAETALNPDGTAGGMYGRTWTVVDDTPVAGAKSVAVVVAWADTTNARSVSLTTIVVE